MAPRLLVWVTTWKTATLSKFAYLEDQSERRGNLLGICFAYLC